MLSDNPIGQPFIHLDVVQSTNNYAMAQVQAQMAAHGFTWFANHQTEGRGQRGKTWQMHHGQNIIMSILIDPAPLQPLQQFYLSAVVSVACHDFFKAYTNGDATIKWPNDLYWKDRKAGGILIENVIKGNKWSHAIVGIGININQTTFPKDLKNPVSLKQITGKSFDVVELANQLCTYIDWRWKQLRATGITTILHDYNNALFRREERVWFKQGDVLFDAIVSGVNENGQLEINNGLQKINFGEVEWVI